MAYRSAEGGKCHSSPKSGGFGLRMGGAALRGWRPHPLVEGVLSGCKQQDLGAVPLELPISTEGLLLCH